MKANELKKSTVFKIDDKIIIVKKVFVQNPHSRGGSTLYKVTGKEISTHQKFEHNFKGDEKVEDLEMTRHDIQLLYRDADGCTFMDTENYDQYTLSDDSLEEELPFLSDGLEGISALVAEGQVLGIELPSNVVLEITECSPTMKAASSSARTKPATLTTGLVVQVPEYLAVGESIKVNTDTREFMSRA
ncbi:MAG: elongation factor P-like protein YeiP [Gammaproteobacteria bacterium]|nr:elongation factor P-like protein YeiP [Gammaproteobacteria bacterium]MDH5388309.1 elongation factor P-like protein YeiP [Gammaproteobacteria bacterium]